MLEMPTRWAPFVGAMRRLAAIPITTMAVSVTEIAITTPFFNFDDRAVALKNTKSIVYRDSRASVESPFSSGNIINAGAKNLNISISSFVLDQSPSLVTFTVVCSIGPIRSDASHLSGISREFLWRQGSRGARTRYLLQKYVAAGTTHHGPHIGRQTDPSAFSAPHHGDPSAQGRRRLCHHQLLAAAWTRG